MKHLHRHVVTLAIAILLAACGGGGDEPPAAAGGTATVTTPGITSAPASANVAEGQTATFTVAASNGGGTLSYQWQLNGVDIAGATASSYTTAATTNASNGASYRVKVTNSAGTTTSAAATLTVSAAAAAAGFNDSAATATDLATEAKAAIAAAESKSQVPGGISLIGALPTGVVTTIACAGGGNYTYDFPTSLSSTTRYAITYNNCQIIAGYTYNGSYTIAYSNFTSATNYSWVATYDMTLVGPNLNYRYAGTNSCSYGSNGQVCTYNDGTRSFSTGFTYSGGRINGSYTWTYGSYGTATFSYSNWTATTGSATITTANGFSATVVRNSATSFTVTINGGTPRTITLN